MRLGDPRLYALAVIMLLAQFSISALNDWADRDRDRAAGRWRPIPLGQLRPGAALAIAACLGILSALATLPLGAAPTFVLITGVAAGWSYDLWLKPTPFSFVPFAIGFPLLILWVVLIAGRQVAPLGWILLGTAVFAVAIHLADSLPDIDDDRAAGLDPLTVRLGRERSVGWMATLLVIGANVAVANLYKWPLVSAGVVSVAVIGAVASVLVGRRHSGLVRWVTAATAFTDLVIVLEAVPHA